MIIYSNIVINNVVQFNIDNFFNLVSEYYMENHNENDVVIFQHYISPAGEIILGSFMDRLCMCDWVNENRHEVIGRRLTKFFKTKFELGNNDIIVKAITELDEYFAHKRTVFDIPLIFAGTEFQKRVWNLLLEVPFGQTMSYGEMAKILDCPNAVRAVANANGANAISIFVPCHRIIGSNHQLVGYGGGLEIKKFLLDLESASLFDVR